MAKLYRNASTDEYYIETAMDGEFVTLNVHPDGREYLEHQGVEAGSRIPAEMFAVLEENAWISVIDQDFSPSPQYADATVVNESETNAPLTDVHVSPDEPLPSVRMEPRPWMEQDNVDRLRADTDPTLAATDQPLRKFSATAADKANANPMTHPEDAAFVGGVWFWVLVVAALAIVVWGLFEIF